MVRQSSEGRACGGGFGKGSVRKRWGDQAGRMWEALLVGVGGREEGSRECLLGNMRKGAQGDEQDENTTLSLGTNAERMLPCEESYGQVRKPGDEIALDAAFWLQKNKEHCTAKSVRESLRITLVRAVL